MKRIRWVDGIRGMVCILVFVHHFLLAFLPAVHFGDVALSHLGNGMDVWFAQSPLSFIVNGNFMVAIFCTVSGMVISIQIMNMKNNNDLAIIVLKRYPRLMLPVIPIGLLVYILLKYNMFFHLKVAEVTFSPWLVNYYLNDMPISNMLRSIFIDIWLFNDNSLSTAFWMLTQLFLGTFLSVILSVLTWKCKRYLIVIYMLSAIICMRYNNLYASFVLGTLLAYLYFRYNDYFGRTIIGWGCLIVGVFMGGYPSTTVTNYIYSLMNFKIFGMDPVLFWHIVGAAFVLYGISNIMMVKKFFSSKILVWLGRISYALYLLHIPLLYSFSCGMFLMLQEKNIGYIEGIFITFIGTVIILVFFAYLYNKYIEKSCNIIIDKFLMCITKEISNVSKS